MDILLFLLIFTGGLVFQTILPGQIRMFLIYPLAFVLGFLTHAYNNFLLFAFAFGMTTRAIVGGYWMCIILELGCLITGFLIGYII